MTRRLIPMMLAAGLALGACGSDAPESTGGASTPATSGTAISISGLAFKPAELDVEAGDTVTWTLDEPTEHTVTAGTPDAEDAAFDHTLTKEGDVFEFTFDESGTFPFFCRIHPNGMRGAIRVA